MRGYRQLRSVWISIPLTVSLAGLAGLSTAWLPQWSRGQSQSAAQAEVARLLPMEPTTMLQVMAPVDGQIVVARLPTGGAPRPLKRGDIVHRGQVLAVIWSPEVGERKSRLLAAVSRLLLDEELVVALGAQGAAAGDIQAAQRHCQLDRESLDRAECELRGLAFEPDEISAIRQCAARLCQHEADAVVTSHWAELELRAPSDGVLIQAQAVGGADVRPGMLLFTIAGR